MNFVNAPVIGHINKEAFERFVCSDIEAIDMDNVVFFKPLFTHILNTELPYGDLERIVFDRFGNPGMGKSNDDRICSRNGVCRGIIDVFGEVHRLLLNATGTAKKDDRKDCHQPPNCSLFTRSTCRSYMHSTTMVCRSRHKPLPAYLR